MNILYLLLAHCSKPLPPLIERCVFNHPTVMSCLIWALVVIILSVIASRYLNKLAQIKKEIAIAAHNHELAMKKEAFEQEQFWYFQKELKKDYQKELNEKVQKLEDEKKQLSEDLDKEKKDRNEALKKERLQAEHDFYEKVLNTFYKIDENQQTKN